MSKITFNGVLDMTKGQTPLEVKQNKAMGEMEEIFKKMHDILYEVEKAKLKQVDQSIKEAFGRNLNMDELQTVLKLLREKVDKVKKRIDKDEFAKVVSKKAEYEEIINHSDEVIRDAQVYLEKSSAQDPGK